MTLIKSLITPLFVLVSMPTMAQDLSSNNVHQTQQNIQYSIRGTLDGVTNIPQRMVNTANNLVFPNTFDQSFSINPWSKKQYKPRNLVQQRNSGLPKGNPWAPVGATQNIPLDDTSIIERNPYTDAAVPVQYNNIVSSVKYNNTYRPYQKNSWLNNNDYNSSNGSFPMPFGSQLWPNNNINSSMPFMPW